MYFCVLLRISSIEKTVDQLGKVINVRHKNNSKVILYINISVLFRKNKRLGKFYGMMVHTRFLRTSCIESACI